MGFLIALLTYLYHLYMHLIVESKTINFIKVYLKITFY